MRTSRSFSHSPNYRAITASLTRSLRAPDSISTVTHQNNSDSGSSGGLSLDGRAQSINYSRGDDNDDGCIQSGRARERMLSTSIRTTEGQPRSDSIEEKSIAACLLTVELEVAQLMWKRLRDVAVALVRRPRVRRTELFR